MTFEEAYKASERVNQYWASRGIDAQAEVDKTATKEGMVYGVKSGFRLRVPDIVGERVVGRVFGLRKEIRGRK